MERKSRMQASSWIAAAEGAAQEYIPVSSNPLEPSYLKSVSATRGEYHARRNRQLMTGVERVAPASEWIATRSGLRPTVDSAAVGTYGASIVLGCDPENPYATTSNRVYGASQHKPADSIDLLQTVQIRRDSTLDGAHRASMTEPHQLDVNDPYATTQERKIRAASFGSASLLRDGMKRHVRSQYDPEEKYTLPPTMQNDIGWGIKAKYGDACAKYQEGAAWHGRTGSHITKFSERLLLGARHHLSGPMTKPKLHY